MKQKDGKSSEAGNNGYDRRQETEKIAPPPLDEDEFFKTRVKSSPAETAKAVDREADVYFPNRTILPDFRRSATGPRPEANPRQRYERQKKLGEGGGGEVELVRDNDIFRLVAIKRLKKDLHNPWVLKRFVEEIRTVGHLEHPNIVPIHDVGMDEEGQYYFIMKYVHGESLESVIRKLKNGDPYYHQKYTFEYRTNIFAEILKAIEFAHHHGIIHRDLKPANIMIGPYGEVQVMDWGIAKQIHKVPARKLPEKLLEDIEASIRESGDMTLAEERAFKSQQNFLIGTPSYMAPEQVLGKNDQLDERTDIYSLCALFYEFLTLRPCLSPKKNLQETLQGVLKEKPRMATYVHSKYQLAVPADLGHFVKKGLAKEPGKRYQSVSEMRTLLQRIQEGYMPIQCPMTLIKRSLHILIHLVNNRPRLGVLLAMLAAALLLAGAIFLASLLQ
jgi:serine/threonine protein kinase